MHSTKTPVPKLVAVAKFKAVLVSSVIRVQRGGFAVVVFGVGAAVAEGQRREGDSKRFNAFG